MLQEKKLVLVKRKGTEYLYIPRIYEEEVSSIKMLRDLDRKIKISNKKVMQTIQKLNSTLDEVQAHAVYVAAKSGFMILMAGLV